ncbi:acyl-CoA dehydrogenase family protein [Nocardia sp. NPDC046763]|uniref:acyl-CoA dehydrogenase family protein n=1 Tax=Nocardia sp. NPDC046763 TaxID=3155256 RepID=UPI0033EE7819
MNPFVLDEDHVQFRDNVRKFAREKLLPGYLERAQRDEYPFEEVKQLGDAGLLGLCLPESLGGQDADLLALGLACEEVSYADVNLATILFLQSAPAALLAEYAPRAVVDRWVPGIVAGDIVHALALTEPGAGSDAQSMTCRAERVPGGWKLYGEKTSITQAPDAHVATVIAQTDRSLRAKGIGAFVVALDDPTITRQRFRDPGARPVGRGSLAFDGTFVPDDHVAVEPGGGFQMVMHEFDLTRTLIGLTVVGAAQRALDLAGAYAMQRTTFGQPLAVNQGVSFPIAEHYTHLAAIRTLAWHALGLRMAGQPHTVEAAMLKWWAPQAGFAAINDAVVLHGHLGWSEEMPLQAMLRDVSGFQIGDGTPQIQKLIIARELVHRPGAQR